MISTVEYIKNPVYSSENGLHIDCLLKLSAFDEELPFTAYKHDVEPHGVAIYNLIIAGEAGPIGAYVPRPMFPNTMPSATDQPVVI